jgi:N-succinyldiaminopimelate aminotransferase
MNPNLDRLHPYPFEKLDQLKRGATPPRELAHISMSIGEPQHAPPPFVIETLRNEMAGLAKYPVARGLAELRQSIAGWLTRRFRLAPGGIDPERHIIPVNGTREGLFAFAQAVCDPAERPVVMMPNPFYQIYEGAALLAGAEPYYLDTLEENGFLPDFDAVPDSIWKRCRLLYLCSPGNPTGAVMDVDYLKHVIELADRHDFIIAADECYAEIYLDESHPPPGILEACDAMGRHDYARCIAFHSLSKRSNLPGLRSGFVAGDAKVIERFTLYRTYHGCAVPIPTQRASIAAWDDDAHVRDNRAQYQEKFRVALEILKPVMDLTVPPAAFYLWPRTPGDDENFVRELYARKNVTTLPGSYLSRDTVQGNPGSGRVRISLVPPVAQCREAAERIREFISG